MKSHRFIHSVIMAAVAVLAGAGSAFAQGSQFPPPPGPVTFCGTQAPPVATSYQLVFDGAAPEAITPAAPVAACPAGSTHSFTLPPARFTVGAHTVRLVATNAFGSTTGPIYTVTVGIAPGPFTITAVISGE
jgi:hypothetical protein